MFSYHPGLRVQLRCALAAVFLLCVLAAQSVSSRAEDSSSPGHNPRHFDGSSLGGPLDISENWLIHGGDDPSFASPQFDDSQWQAISGYKPLSTYGIHDQPIVWYRLHIQVPASETDLSLAFQRFHGSFEVYVNGIRVGGLGRMTKGGVFDGNYAQTVIVVPAGALNHGTLVIAIRAAIGVASWGEKHYGGIYDARIGRSASLADAAALNSFRDLTSGGYHFFLQAIVVLVLIALIIALPGQREYSALVVSFLFACAYTFVANAGAIPYLHISVLLETEAELVLQLGQLLFLVEFAHLVMRKSRPQWVRTIQLTLAIYSVVSMISRFLALNLHVPFSPAASRTLLLFYLLAWSPFIFALPTLLFWEWRKQRNHDAGLLLLPILTNSCFQGYLWIGASLASLHLPGSIKHVVPIDTLHMTWDELTDILVTLMLLIYIIFRVVRTVRAGAHYAAEVEAAHTIQQVLLSRSTQATPGFKVETVYLPASEVGGDFFLVSPAPDGALIALVGDVAGKGMLAAMRVSVILGALRREERSQPSQILEGLNEAMMRQGDMGMTTACCIRIEPGGRFSVANAGHISPYIAGEEFLTAGALPLGIVTGCKYEQTDGFLPAEKIFVLMSDGVVEARSERLGLYGFERLAPLTKLPAREIAETAKAFGQEDDITVVTVSCTA